MSVLIDLPGYTRAMHRPMTWGGVLEGPLGGASQNLHRMGDRMAVDFELAPLAAASVGRRLIAQLRRAKNEGALIAYPQNGIRIGSPGAPVINGAGQAGTSLLLRGFTPHYAVRIEQAFSLIHDGRRYLHAVQADGRADAAGKVTIIIEPMLRFITTDGDVAEFARPMIEGDVTFAGWSSEPSLKNTLGFSVAEAR